MNWQVAVLYFKVVLYFGVVLVGNIYIELLITDRSSAVALSQCQLQAVTWLAVWGGCLHMRGRSHVSDFRTGRHGNDGALTIACAHIYINEDMVDYKLSQKNATLCVSKI
jgi:hypothetical protein